MRRLVAVISAIVFLDAMLFGALIPLVPAYVDDFDLNKLQAGMLAGHQQMRRLATGGEGMCDRA